MREKESGEIDSATPKPAGAPLNGGRDCQYQAHCQKLRLSVFAAAFIAAIASAQA